MTVHSLPLAEVDERARRTWRCRLQMALILLVCAAPAIASYVAVYVVRPDVGEAAYGDLVQPSVTLPNVDAVDLRGHSMPLHALKGQWLLLTVGPSTCDAACEQRLFVQRQLRAMLGRERDRVDKVWLVTDEGSLAPALQQAVTSGVPVQVLRMAKADVQAWLKPARGQMLEEHL